MTHRFDNKSLEINEDPIILSMWCGQNLRTLYCATHAEEHKCSFLIFWVFGWPQTRCLLAESFAEAFSFCTDTHTNEHTCSFLTFWVRMTSNVMPLARNVSSLCTDMPGGACCLVYDLDRGLGYAIFSWSTDKNTSQGFKSLVEYFMPARHY